MGRLVESRGCPGLELDGGMEFPVSSLGGGDTVVEIGGGDVVGYRSPLNDVAGVHVGQRSHSIGLVKECAFCVDDVWKLGTQRPPWVRCGRRRCEARRLTEHRPAVGRWVCEGSGGEGIESDGWWRRRPLVGLLPGALGGGAGRRHAPQLSGDSRVAYAVSQDRA